MDYNFNLRHSSHKRMKVPSFFQQPGLERCFSTSSNLNVNPCLTNKLSVNPLINLISGLKKNSTNRQKMTTVTPLGSGSFPGAAAVSVTSLPSTPFSGTSMSVSCFVGGLVGGEDAFKQSQEYCDNFLVEVLLNEYSKVPEKPQCSNEPPKDEPARRRTYAEVTKEKPKPRNPTRCTQISLPPVNGVKASFTTMNSLKRETKSCDNLTILPGNHIPSSDGLQSRVLGISKICSDTVIYPTFMRLKSYSSSSESSSEPEKSISRTISESSVESDDSFIVFQNDDGAICDSSEEEISDDDDSEEEDTANSCAEKVSSLDQVASNSTKKKVNWKEDRELVKIHRLVTWDYASRAARIGPWEEHRRDRERFWRRIKDVSCTLNPILDTAHRQRIFEERFALT